MLAFFEELDQRRDISIGHLYFGLMSFKHTAADTILSHMEGNIFLTTYIYDVERASYHFEFNIDPHFIQLGHL